MSPRPSPLGYFTEARHLEVYLGATEAEIERLASNVEVRLGFLQFVQSRRGKRRRITLVTDEGLRAVHGRILQLLTPVAEDLPHNLHAFIPGRSVRSNAALHIGSTFIQSFDLADFFAQVSKRAVIDGLVHFGASEEIAALLARLTTVEGALPMGFMTSPMLANTSLYAFDLAVQTFASQQGLTVTRYADDIVFSASRQFDVAREFEELVRTHGLVLNPDKTRSARKGQRLVVTGLTIAHGDRPRLPREYRAGIRQELHYVSKYGLEGHAEFLRTPMDYVRKRLGGRLAYAESVDPEWVRRVAERFPEAFQQVSRSGSPISALKRAASLARLAHQVRERAAAPLPMYFPRARYNQKRS